MMLEAFWASRRWDGPLSWLCCRCGTGKAACSRSSPAWAAGAAPWKGQAGRAQSPGKRPQHCQPWASPRPLYLPSDKHGKQSRTREAQEQWDESRWQDWEGPEIPGRLELQRIGLICEKVHFPQRCAWQEDRQGLLLSGFCTVKSIPPCTQRLIPPGILPGSRWPTHTGRHPQLAKMELER